MELTWTYLPMVESLLLGVQSCRNSSSSGVYESAVEEGFLPFTALLKPLYLLPRGSGETLGKGGEKKGVANQ